MNIKNVIYAFIFICTIFCAKSQIIKDNQGKDFWLTFPPNFHNEQLNFSDVYLDSLYVFIASQKTAEVTIVATNTEGIPNTKKIVINDVNKVYTVGYSWKEYEVNGINYSGDYPYVKREDQLKSKKGFHITSTEDITVYAASHAQNTTDATLVLPTDALGSHYIVAAYNMDMPGNLVSITPSQFIIIATQNNTKINISPSCATARGDNDEFEIELQSGESYLVQADTELSESESDLSGTIITSEKPISVFGGHQRALIPYNLSINGSRDMLFEQMPSTETWGKDAFVIPAQSVPNEINQGSDLYRVYAGFDSTIISINGIAVQQINSGSFSEFPVNGVSYVSSKKPIMVVYYRKTSGANIPPLPIGDPYMMVLPPIEQYIQSCKFICPDIYRVSNKEYQKHFVTLITPTRAIDSVSLDNSKIPSSQFSPITGTKYSHTTIEIEATTHDVSCSSPIGVYVYGYGEAVSYGYVGGMRFEKINVVTPETCDRKNQPAGLPNTYYKVLEVNSSESSVSIENSIGLCEGDKVLIIQMQGADINQQNSSEYGTILSLNNCGNYEFARIAAITDSKVIFTKPLQKQYTPSQRVQLIRVPEFDNYTVSSPLSCKEWDGELGGVLTFSVNGTLILNSFIDVSGKGFRGGTKTNSLVNAPQHIGDFVAMVDSTRYSRKGEGIFGWNNPANRAGRGAAASGGGGGNNHNGGGGGGSNIGCGGMGGYGWLNYTGQREQAQGIGGYAITTSENKVFLGGGGGAGHSNELSGTDGGNGGGIIIIQAKEIVTNNNQIIASRGLASANSAYDGVGGGGAGGSIIIDCRKFTNALNLDVKGGAGGSLTDHKDGPGGGGGGGLIAFTAPQIPPTLQLNIVGGGRGTNKEFLPDGAVNGCSGAVLTNLTLPGDNTVVSSIGDEYNSIEHNDIYPNPSSDYIYVDKEFENFVITNSLGYSFNVKSVIYTNSIEIDVAGLPAGVYMISSLNVSRKFIVIK